MKSSIICLLLLLTNTVFSQCDTSKKIMHKYYFSLAKEFNYAILNKYYSYYNNTSPACGFYLGTSISFNNLLALKAGLGLGFLSTSGMSGYNGKYGIYSEFNESKHCVLSFPVDFFRTFGKKTKKFIGVGYQHFRWSPYESWTYSSYGQAQTFTHDSYGFQEIIKRISRRNNSNSNLCFFGGFLLLESKKQKIFFEVRSGLPWAYYSRPIEKPFIFLQFLVFLK